MAATRPDQIASMLIDEQLKLTEVIKVANQVELDQKMDGSAISQPETVSQVRHGANAKQSKCYRCRKIGHKAFAKIVQGGKVSCSPEDRSFHRFEILSSEDYKED